MKILLGKNRHFFEAGIYANFAYDHEIGGIIGYRYALVKSPLFFRISLNRVEAATTTTIWGGLSIGVRL